MSGCSRRTFNLVLCGATVELVACGSSLATVAPSGNQVTLAYAQFPALMSPGGSAVVQIQNGFPLAVVRTGDATAVALSATCTHAACIVQYDAAQSFLHCNCHNADFDLQGAVLRGPTTIPLPTYAASPNADGIVVDLS
ncbi:MAG TPA: Rieske (2Fe-2S) protein [Polyangia bacterium]